MSGQARGDRRRQILEALAHQLEVNPGERMTTAGLAAGLGISEAALYRHFASKAQMYEGLLEFAEESIFARVNLILGEEADALRRVEKILTLTLVFAERNPGITRLLTGDVLVGEQARLRERVQQFYDRIETQLRQVLREGELAGRQAARAAVPDLAELFVSVVAGKMQHYVRSDFGAPPTRHWERQWSLLAAGARGV